MPLGGATGAHGDGLDAQAPATVGHVHDLVGERGWRGRGIEHGVDRVPARGLDGAGQALGGEDQRRQLVVLARVAGHEGTLADVVEISRKRDIAGRAADVIARGDERLGDPTDQQAVGA